MPVIGSGSRGDEEGSALGWIASEDNDEVPGSTVFPPLTKPSPFSTCSRGDIRRSSSSSVGFSTSSDNSSGGVGNSEDSIVLESEK